MNWEENRELGVVRLHIFNSRISNSRKIPGPKKRELGGHTVLIFLIKKYFMEKSLKFGLQIQIGTYKAQFMAKDV